MTRFKLASLCFASLTLLTQLPGCGERKPSGETMDESSTGSESDSNSTTNQVPTEGDTTTNDPTDPTDPTVPTSTTDMTTTTTNTTVMTTVSTEPPGCGDEENQANNSACHDMSGCGCSSGNCFVVPILGGWCGECLTDADCDGGGCTVPNPIAGTGAVCNKGEAGDGCNTSDVCVDPANASCGVLLEVPGIISVATCGECSVNAECLDPELPNCTPTYDVENFTGKYVCAADATVPNNEGCNLTQEGGEPVGNAACQSGFCGEANVMGLLKVGICGECNSNEDCPQGQTCSDPQVDLDSAALIGSVCN